MFKQEFSKNSTKCMEHIDKIKKKIKLPEMNSKSKRFFKNILLKLKPIYSDILLKNKDFVVSKKCVKHLKPNLESSFLDSNTIIEINNNSCLINPRKGIKFYTNPKQNFNEQVIKTVYARTLLMEKIFNKNVSDLKVSLITELRLLPDHKIQIKPKNINGGWTYFIGDKTGLVIYRLEEFAKVLLHELLHSFHFNLSNDAEEFYSKSIQKIIEYNTSSTIINEAYIELAADILNSIFLQIESNKLDFFKILEYERYWSLYQAAKLLIHYGFNSFSQFLKYNKCMSTSIDDDICRQKCSEINNGKCSLIDFHPIVTESTNFVSYIINRAIAFYLIDDYTNVLSNTLKINSNNISLLFDINENSNEFVSLILGGYTNKNFVKKMNSLMKYIKKNEFEYMYSSKDFSIFNTLRITACELNY